MVRRLGPPDDREARIIGLRFGLDRDRPTTLAQVDRAPGEYTRERVRQLQDRALTRLQETAV